MKGWAKTHLGRENPIASLSLAEYYRSAITQRGAKNNKKGSGRIEQGKVWLRKDGNFAIHQRRFESQARPSK